MSSYEFNGFQGLEVPRTEWESILDTVCTINNWEQTKRKCWSIDNGRWHAMSTAELGDLEHTFRALSKMAKDNTQRQWLIESNVLDFIKNILAKPTLEEKHHDVMTCAWQLLFDLTWNSTNHTTIWMEFREILLESLRQNIYNDLCHHIIFNIYAIARIVQHEGLNIFKVLLHNFGQKKQNGPVKDQGLTICLEHFMTDEWLIRPKYHQLLDSEKSLFLQFILDCMCKKDGEKDYSISPELLGCICDDFSSKNKLFSCSSAPQQSLLQTFELFETISYASKDERHQLNKFNFKLLLSSVHLFRYVRSNVETAELYFGTIKRNSDVSLKELILSTIINLVKDNAEHKEKARDAGLIEILVNYVAEERCRHLYKCTLYALIEMCQTSPLNMKSVEDIAKTKDWTGSVAVEDFLYDMNYKGERIY